MNLSEIYKLSKEHHIDLEIKFEDEYGMVTIIMRSEDNVIKQRMYGTNECSELDEVIQTMFEYMIKKGEEK